MQLENKIGIVGVVIVMILTAAYAMQYDSNMNNLKAKTNSTVLSPANQAAGAPTLTVSEAAKHNTAQDCWLIISNKVYDVTNFLSSHPGGAGTIIPFCGQEATMAFDTKDGRGVHSQTANALLASYYIGDIGQIQGTQHPAPNNTILPPVQNPPAQNTTTVQPSTVALTVSEIAKHNTVQNCWLLISGKVYDVTSFIPSHPGGAGQITPFCGQDATTAFDTRGGTGAHSQTANSMLASYYIGDLNSQVPTPTPVNTTVPPTRPFNNFEDDD